MLCSLAVLFSFGERLKCFHNNRERRGEEGELHKSDHPALLWVLESGIPAQFGSSGPGIELEQQVQPAPQPGQH